MSRTGRAQHAELCDAAAEIQPDVIGLSLTMPVLGTRLERQAAALQEICPEACFLLGGQGVSPELAERISATSVLDVEQLVDMADSRSLCAPALTAPDSR